MSAIRGQLHDPLAGVSRPAEVSWDSGAAALLVGIDGTAARSIAAARLTLVGGGWQKQAVHFSWTDDGRVWAVTVAGAEALQSLRALVPPELAEALDEIIAAGQAAGGRGRRTLAVLTGLVLLPVLALTAAFVFRESIVSAILRRLPESVDSRLGEASFRALESTGMLLASGPAVDGVRALGDRLAAAAVLPEEAAGARPERSERAPLKRSEGASLPYRFRFEVIRDPSVNAFAAPGGLVVVHTGLLLAASSTDELAGVLAHEVVHVLERHSLRQMIFQAGLGTAARLLIGAPDGAAEILTGATLNLTALRFGRDQEAEADRGGLRLLRGARLPGEGLTSFFARLAAKDGTLPPLLSSHPPAHDRVSRLEAERSRLGSWRVERVDIDWVAVQADARSPR